MLPDIVLLLTDQERAPPSYESEALKQWRARALRARRSLDDAGVRFERHYTAATACVPSRPSLLTGHYPDLHGVTQTDGFGKEANDPSMRWLRPGEVPTLGHWFRALGYDTRYVGKWHLSDAALRDEQGRPLPTNTRDGAVIPATVERYLKEQPLEPFGFRDWIGPEPHGAGVADSGLVRDPLIARQAVRILRERDPRRPLLLVVSFVNPHDIVFWPVWSRRSPLRPDPEDPPATADAPTESDSLSDRPATQAAFQEAYFGLYGPRRVVRSRYERHARKYRRTYHRLHLEVDRHLGTVLHALRATPRASQTILAFTADHGDLLGAHGGLHQKWMNLYDEAVRVPFVVVPDGASGPRGVVVKDAPTSHVDVLPTLLGLVGASVDPLRAEIEKTHSEVHPLPGRDLSPVIRGREAPDRARRVFLMTRDAIAEGAERSSRFARLLGVHARSGPLALTRPRHVASSVEALVARVPTGSLVKLVRTFDDPALWSEPLVRHVEHGAERTEPIPDALELYDLDLDPAEAVNRATEPEWAPVLGALRAALEAERARAIPPRRSPWPYAARPERLPPPPRALRAPHTLTRTRVVGAAPAAVWAVLSRFGDIAKWLEGAAHSSLMTSRSEGVGTFRRVQVDGATVLERVITWDPPRELAYTLEGLPPIVTAAQNRWRLSALGAHTRVELTTTLHLANPVAERILLPAVLAPLLGKTLDRLLRGLDGAARAE